MAQGPTKASKPRESPYTRVNRMLRILMLVQSRPGWNIDKLTAEFNVGKRTLHRDLRALEKAGVPCKYSARSKGYEIRGDFFMPPVELTFDEALALVALGEHIGEQEQVPLLKPAGKAIAKIRCQLPARIREELQGLEDHLHIQLAAAQSPHGIDDVYDEVRVALLEKKALRLTYESTTPGSAKDEPFDFEPYALFFSQRAWYVIGHHSRHREIRCLKLNRFTSRKLTDKSYNIPKDFSLRKHLGKAWRMIRGKKTYAVELHFDPAFAETISDTHWHDTQDIQTNDDGSLTVRFEVDGLDEIVWWVLSMGPYCKVVKPAELAQRVRDMAGKMVELYAKGQA